MTNTVSTTMVFGFHITRGLTTVPLTLCRDHSHWWPAARLLTKVKWCSISSRASHNWICCLAYQKFIITNQFSLYLHSMQFLSVNATNFLFLFHFYLSIHEIMKRLCTQQKSFQYLIHILGDTMISWIYSEIYWPLSSNHLL